MAVDIYTIEWTKLQPFDKAINQSASQEGGVYAMFKDTPRGYKLYYIGMCKEFAKRFGTHRNTASHLMSDSDYSKLTVSFGRISCFAISRLTHDIPPAQLRQVEQFLINEIQPQGNAASTKKGYKGQPILIFNRADTILRSLFKKEMTNSVELLKLLKSSLNY